MGFALSRGTLERTVAEGAAMRHEALLKRRQAAPAKPPGHGPPAYLVHTDSADRSWPWRVDEILDLELLRQHRVALRAASTARTGE